VAVGAELTVTGAEVIARSLGVSDRVIGLSIVAIGTSLPELAAGIASALKGQTEIGLGNVVGSNVFNVLVAIGAAGIVRPIGASGADGALIEETLRSDIPLVLAFSLAAAVLPRLGAGRWMGAVLLIGYVAFLWIQF
jgi:cation:H+ antiporter